LPSGAATAFTAEFGGRTFTTPFELVEGGPDAVIIVVPPFAHGDVEAACLRANVPFLIEKTVDLDLNRARNVSAQVRAQGLVTAVAYQHRYYDVVRRVGEELAQRRAGLAFAYWMGGLPKSSWWGRKEMSGGQAVEQTTHWFDLLRWWFGPAQTVYAGSVTRWIPPGDPRTVEDATCATIAFRSGVLAVVASACFLQVRENGVERIEIFCPDATLRYEPNQSLTVATSDALRTYKRQNDNENEMFTDFLAAVQKGNPDGVLCPYEQGVESLELTLAVNRALERGTPVNLPL
jgi:predicted dehydrogenase